ncbi:DNA polymerase III subunit gamma/tau [Bifidobacterium callitrichos]|uniref:DNA-directed DNA polymerase n=2 Tax=Bifidobacteriaceae TaxID=31953 RepID=A0A5M9ZCE1_9BIFI|nr:DNA polymerase III subunit gamma/tau [Bifidobacterium callitrichos]KAA8816433.1 DNA polymerase III subunit gamma/tau [Bifidobacterium callitrichos]
MALALYRRYRPDTFEGVIGQDQVTVPLMRALDEGKLTHAYLFSGPRGCGKTSSARILARCVNCEKGPTSHPCGECESCKDLATGGPGSIDVVEIDAASHNGVDDARELRERAGFAPARDRYKIFILDEAHMVTPQGFNALLKIVEEPPEHVMFIFATTEPDKVIGTIRSRTHHYPFRLVPAEIMGPYLEKICDEEHIKPEPGVLRLAMRAGGGSVRDTLSVLDQLMVGSVDGVITHDASVALLGFTPEALIGEAIDAVIDRNGKDLYGVIQKVVVGGFDPRRFVEDLLARVRDLLVLTLAGDRAESVLSDTAEAEEMGDLHRQAAALGLGALTAMADIINDTLGAMTGAISPRMRLELLAARLLAGAETGFAAPAPAAIGSGAGNGMGGAQASAGAGTAGAGTTGGFAGNSGAGNAVGSGHGSFAGAARNAGGARGNAGGVGGGFAGAARNQQAVAGAGFAVSSAAAGDAGNAGVSGAGISHGDGFVNAAVSVAAAASTSGAGASAAGSAAASTAAGDNTSQVTGGTAAPAASDNRTPDQKWDALVASLPDDVRRYVTRDKVLRISLRPYKQTGRMRLWLKFDKPLSKYAFALAVASEEVDGSNKVVSILRSEVRKVFGEQTEIAPTPTTDDGQKTPAFSKLPMGEQQRIKAQLLQENLKAAASLSATAESAASSGNGGQESSREHAAQSAHTASASSDDDEAHRARSAALSALDDDDPWAHPTLTKPAASAVGIGGNGPRDNAGESGADEHHHKHVAVPDLSDGIDPWAQPAAMPKPGNIGAGHGVGDHSSTSGQPGQSGQHGQPEPSGTGAGGDDRMIGRPTVASSAPAGQNGRSAYGDPWNQPARPAGPGAGAPDAWLAPSAGSAPTQPNRPSGTPGPGSQRPVPNEPDDPWKDVPPPSEPDDPWNTPSDVSRETPAKPAGTAGVGVGGGAVVGAGSPADPWNVARSQSPASARPQVSADEDEYSMDDQSLGEATAMDRNELLRMFEVKKVEQFAADDPHNPRNAHPAPKHDDE